MKDFKQFFSQKDRDSARDLIRRYLEGDASEIERQTIRKSVQGSDDWRQEYEKMEDYLSHLRSLQTPNPPERIWEKVNEFAETHSPTRVWFPWFYARPAWGMTFKLLPVLILIALFIGVGNNFWYETQYEFIVVEEVNGLGLEAESYELYHDLADEPLPIRESLLAFSTNIGSR